MRIILDYNIPYSSLGCTMDIQDFFQTFLYFLPRFDNVNEMSMQKLSNQYNHAITRMNKFVKPN